MKLNGLEYKSNITSTQIDPTDLKFLRSKECLKNKDKRAKSLIMPRPHHFAFDEYEYWIIKYGSWSKFKGLLENLKQENGYKLFNNKGSYELTDKDYSLYAEIAHKYMADYVSYRKEGGEELISKVGLRGFYVYLKKRPSDLERWIATNNLLSSVRVSPVTLNEHFKEMLASLYKRFSFVNRAEVNYLRKLIRYPGIAIPEDYPFSDEGCETLLTSGKHKQKFENCMEEILGESWNSNRKHAVIFEQDDETAEVYLDSFFEADVLRALIEMELMPTHIHYKPGRKGSDVDFAWLNSDKEVLISLEALMVEGTDIELLEESEVNKNMAKNYVQKEIPRARFFKEMEINRRVISSKTIHHVDTFITKMSELGRAIGDAIGKEPKLLTVAYRNQVFANKENKNLSANVKLTSTNIRNWVKNKSIEKNGTINAPSYAKVIDEFGEKAASFIRRRMGGYRKICSGLKLKMVNGSVPRKLEEFLQLAEQNGHIDREKKLYKWSLTDSNAEESLKTAVKYHDIVQQFNDTTDHLQYPVTCVKSMLAALGYHFESTVGNRPPIVFRSKNEIIKALRGKGEKNKIKAVGRGEHISKLVKDAIIHFFGEDCYSDDTSLLKSLCLARFQGSISSDN